MSEQRVHKPLGDIGNTVGTKDARNVFERLTFSPKKKTGDRSDKVVWKPALRVSPRKSSTDTQQINNVNETPKRLSTPPFLKEYNSRITQSLDRPQFDGASAVASSVARPRSERLYGLKNSITDTPTNALPIESSNANMQNDQVFLRPISPTKITFSNEKKKGGDGTSSRILSRIRNIRASPLRAPKQAQVQVPPIKKKNLSEMLRQEEHGNSNRNKRVRFQMPNQPASATYLRPTTNGISNTVQNTSDISSEKSDTSSTCSTPSRPNRDLLEGNTQKSSTNSETIARIRTLEHTVWSLDARIKQLEEMINKK